MENMGIVKRQAIIKLLIWVILLLISTLFALYDFHGFIKPIWKSNDKVLHLLFSMLFYIATLNLVASKSVVKAMLLTFFTGFAFEILQEWLTTTRHFHLKDLVYNILGIAVGYIVSVIAKQIKNRLCSFSKSH